MSFYNPPPHITPPDRWRFVLPWLLAYIALLTLFLLNHQPWEDEADSWLVAADLPWEDFFTHTANVGMPGLWWLLLMPLAKTGMPYISMHILHGLIATLNAFLILRYAPFPRLIRILLIFSAYFAYEYAVIARHYAFSFTIIILLMMLHHRRMQRPILYGFLLGMLFQTNVMIIGVGLGLYAAFLWEGYVQHGKKIRATLQDKPFITGAMLTMALGLLALYQLWPGETTAIGFGQSKTSLHDLLAMLYGLSGDSLFLVDTLLEPGNLQQNIISSIALWLTPLSFYLIFLSFSFLFKNQRSLCFVALANFFWVIAVFLLIYSGGTRHVAFLTLLLLFLLWPAFSLPHQSKAALNQRKLLLRTLTFFVLSHALITAAWAYATFVKNLSLEGTHHSLQVINRQKPLSHNNLITVDGGCFTDVLPYLREQYPNQNVSRYNLYLDEMQSYSSFDKDYWNRPKPDTVSLLWYALNYLPEKQLQESIFCVRFMHESPIFAQSGFKILLSINGLRSGSLLFRYVGKNPDAPTLTTNGPEEAIWLKP